MTPSIFRSIAAELGLEAVTGMDNVDLLFAHRLMVEADKKGLDALRDTEDRERQAQEVRERIDKIKSYFPGDLDDLIFPGAKGSFEGRPVLITTEVGSNNKELLLGVNFQKPFPTQLQLFKEGFAAKFGKLFGGQDIQLAQPTLDPLLIVRGKDEDAVRKGLTTTEAVKALAGLFNSFPGAAVNQISARCSLAPDKANKKVLGDALTMLSSVAAALEP